jgi:hypothetical protein
MVGLRFYRRAADLLNRRVRRSDLCSACTLTTITVISFSLSVLADFCGLSALYAEPELLQARHAANRIVALQYVACVVMAWQPESSKCAIGEVST